jgi:hypothetical protein
LEEQPLFQFLETRIECRPEKYLREKLEARKAAFMTSEYRDEEGRPI